MKTTTLARAAHMFTLGAQHDALRCRLRARANAFDIENCARAFHPGGKICARAFFGKQTRLRRRMNAIVARRCSRSAW
eukprot:346520-Lingulodinium_polyedra.AAC.1